MPRREGDKILFDSPEQKERVASVLWVSNDSFYSELLKIVGKIQRESVKVWGWVHKELEGQLGPDEILVFRYDENEMFVVKSTDKLYPEREKVEVE